MAEASALWIERIRVGLDCPRCGMETCHDVHYVAGLLHWARCTRCDRVWQVSRRLLEERYIRRVPERIVSKPGRMLHEFQREPLPFALSLPLRLMSKPIRVAGELGMVVGVLDEPW